ncbi:hypothetical protein BGY98DRAFT_649492 [Russula aff. rugulosa BPL654]|nr:hypothetical protein BGY98DRAFT_649492 [Russula aff. rugulosa BPL654]
MGDRRMILRSTIMTVLPPYSLSERSQNSNLINSVDCRRTIVSKCRTSHVHAREDTTRDTRLKNLQYRCVVMGSMNTQITDYLFLHTPPPSMAQRPLRTALMSRTWLIDSPVDHRDENLGQVRVLPRNVLAQVLNLDHSKTWQRAFEVIVKQEYQNGPVWIRLESSSYPNGHLQTEDSQFAST